MRGCLEQFAFRTPVGDLERAFGNYNPSLPQALRQESITPEGFALVLARAGRIEEEDRERFVRQYIAEREL